MQLSKKSATIVFRTIETLVQEGTLDSVTASRIRTSIQVRPFDWRRLARYAFVTAIICVVISITSLLADEAILQFLEKLFHAPAAVRSVAMAGLAAALLFFGLKRRRRHPEKIYSNEAIFFCAVLGIAGSIAFLGQAIDTGSGHYSLLLLLAAFVYGFLGLALESKLIWIFCLLSIGGWFGAETGYESGWGAYYLGMAYPLRFVLFGAGLTLSSALLLRVESRRAFYRPTLAMGLLYLFIALWILSIWGNYQGYDDWRQASHFELLHWSLYFGLAAVASVYLGLKLDDSMLRGFGLTFLFINLYTRFFELFWDNLHKGLFFGLLALSFWLIGSKAEAIWHLEGLQNRIKPAVTTAPKVPRL
jgi:hypothetical protein